MPGVYAGERAHNSAVECHLHTVEVVGSNPAGPTIINNLHIANLDPGPISPVGTGFGLRLRSALRRATSSFVPSHKNTWLKKFCREYARDFRKQVESKGRSN